MTRTYPGPGPGVPGGAVGAGAGQLRLGPRAEAQRLVDLREGEHHQGRNRDSDKLVLQNYGHDLRYFEWLCQYFQSGFDDHLS